MNEHPLLYALYGLVAGFSEFVPVSASAHQMLFSKLLGFDSYRPMVMLFVHAGMLGALIFQFRKRLFHIRWELQLVSLPAKRRKRPPDIDAVLDARLVMTAAVPALLGAALSFLAEWYCQQLLLLSLLLIGGATAIYSPDYLRGGNRKIRAMSRLDGILLGLCAGLSVIPGFSAMGSMLALGLIRKCDRAYLTELSLLIFLPFLGGSMIADLIGIFVSGFSGISFAVFFGSLLAAACAFGSGIAAILLMRYLSVKIGFSGFSYYGWGLGLFSFILYLMV